MMSKNLADLEIPLRFNNYKRFKGDNEFVLKDSYVYFISGPCDTGKTSFKDVFAILQSGKNDIDQPVTRGEEEGFIETKIPGADGKMYLIRHDFTDESHNKFVAIDEDGKKISAPGDFRKIFNYTHFTAEEFFLWTDKADGRKKQREIILNLLPEQSLTKYNELDQLELVRYDERTEKGKIKDQFIELCKSGRLNEDEQVFVDNLQEYKNKLSGIQERLNKVSTTNVQRSSLESRQKELTSNINNIGVTINNAVSRYNTDLSELNSTITELEEKLLKAKERREALQNQFPLEKRKAEDQLANYREDLGKVNNELGQLPSENTDELLKEKSQLEASIEIANTIKARVMNLNENTTKKDQAIREYEEMTRVIDKIREDKKELIASANLGIQNISIEDDYVMIDGFPFKENQIAKSQAIVIVAKLMCVINQSPIQVIGSANDLDWPILDKLYEIAKTNGKIMILDQVDRDATDLAVIGYEPKNISE